MDIQSGGTNQTVSFAAYTTATGAAVTVTSATTGLSLWYRRGTNGAKTAISASDLTALTDAHSDGGILVIEGAEHRLDLPDVAVAAGVDRVEWGGTATDITIDGGTADLIGQATSGPVGVMRGTDGAYTGTPPTAAAIADAVHDEARAAHTGAGSFGELVGWLAEMTEDDAGVRRYTTNALEQGSVGSGATAAQVWAYSSRTLTQTAAQVTSLLVSGNDVTAVRGDTLTMAITGMGSIADRSNLWISVKDDRGKTDANSVIQVDTTTGLVVLNGSSSVTAGDAGIVVDDEDAGDITITIKPAASKDLPAPSSLNYDIQVLRSTGIVNTLASGAFSVTQDVTRAVS